MLMSLARVCVLLSTYNGETYLAEQLDSLLRQENVTLCVRVRDDGSTDGTQRVLETYRKRFPDVLEWTQGKENLRAARSFMELVQTAPDADYYAFCDQDDVWDSDKLICAVRAMEAREPGRPLLYYSNVRVVDASLALIEQSDISPAEVRLRRALLHNVVIGCTAVMNRVLREALCAYTPDFTEMLHDWWAVKVCLALGGETVFDPVPHMGYRQHGQNVLGFYDKPTRSLRDVLFTRPPCSISRCAGELLAAYGDAIPAECREAVAVLAGYRADPRLKWRLLTDNGYYASDRRERLKEKLSVLRGRK